jgi:carbon-monoxide dehydrogenase iron sulfur subunit
MKNVFIDLEKCIGCRHCEVACAIEHSSGKDLFSMYFEVPRPQPRISVKLGVDLMTFPNKCQHCDPAPCMEVCPVNAIFRDVETDTVQIQEDRCISCGMCAMVCPYGAIQYQIRPNLPNEVAYKCDSCISRLENGKEPACVEACVTNALVFGDYNEIIAEKQRGISLNLTREIQGYKEEKIPENIEAFRALQRKIALLGPLPSSQNKISMNEKN